MAQATIEIRIDARELAYTTRLIEKIHHHTPFDIIEQFLISDLMRNGVVYEHIDNNHYALKWKPKVMCQLIAIILKYYRKAI